MFGKLLNFELKLHTRKVGFWLAFIIMFLLGFMIMSWDAIDVSGAGERIKKNGALIIAGMSSTFSIGAIFFAAIFVVGGMMRDQVYKSVELVHSTQIDTFHLTITRMIGVYVATFLCIFAMPLGMFVGQFMPWIDQETLGPIKLSYFLAPAFVFIAINTLVVSGIYAAIAAITRNRALVYVSAIALFMMYLTMDMLAGQTTSSRILALAEPMGARAMASVSELWAADEQNTRLIPLWGIVGLNRLIWGGVGLGLYGLTIHLFKRGLVQRKTKLGSEEETASTGRIILEPAKPIYTLSATIKTFAMRFKFEYLTTVKSIPFLILTLLAAAFFGLVILGEVVIGASTTLPTSIKMVGTALGSLALPLMIIVVFFSSEVIWRDKVSGITEILDASPVKNWPLMAAKWLTVIAIVFTILSIGIIIGMITQMILGDVPVHVPTYLKSAFMSFAPRIVLLSILALFIQNFMPNRMAGMLAAAALLIFFMIGIVFLPFYHPLMGYGRMGTGGLSELNSFANLSRFKWFGLYWGSLAALLTLFSIGLWRRGLQTSIGGRLKGIGKRLSVVSMAIAAVFLAGFAGSGAYIFKAYNIDNSFRTRKQNELRTVKWEKIFGEDLKKAIPKIRSVEAEVTFTPSKRTAISKGSYVIENTTGAPLEELYISMPSRNKESIKTMEISGATQVTKGDNAEAVEDFGYRLYKFEPALASGAKTGVKFETFYNAPRLGAGGNIMRNGTFVNNFSIMPGLGIQDRRMQNPDRRRKYGLDELEKKSDRSDMDARQFNFINRSADYVDFKASVCTDIGQIPIAPGKLVKTYEENGKACRDYQAINPILNFFSFLSADFEVIRDVWNNPNGTNVDLAIYHHSAHDYNVALMLEAMKKSLTTFTKTFGPYQYSQIRIMEFPYGGFAQSFAGTIPFSENIGFVQDPGELDDNKTMDLASYVTMHEIGHQWFAHQIVPADTKGFNVLSEGLTENAAMTAYEEAFGWQKARRVLEERSIGSTVRGYLIERTADRDDEPPLAKAGNQSYLVYAKASWVFWGLKQYMGEEKMQTAIRGFLQEYGSKGPLYPTTKELVDALRAAAPEDMQGLITDYWDRITFWELMFDGDIDVSGDDAAGYTVSFTAKVDKKIASEETGKETSVSEIDGEELAEWVEIGFYKEDPKKTLGGEWLQLERVRITKQETKLSFKMKEKPAYVLLDPRRLLIEKKVTDNVKQIKEP